MATVLHFDCGLPYQDRTEALKASGVALWDVLYSCVRPGSLDAAIKTGTRVPNDFQHFLNTHSYIRKIAFNGAEAEKSFNRYVLPSIDSKGICFVRLPSSSPAHAIHFDRKVEVWRYCLGN
jgi:hypoxanthine-DNA glycosylase